LWVQTADAVEVQADLPGLKKEEISVDIDNNVLTLKVAHEEKKEETRTDDPEKEGATTWHRTERSRVYVMRSIVLPEAANTDAAKATYNNGVLSINFPKKAPAPPPIKLSIT
jgi:HSP20 family protein